MFGSDFKVSLNLFSLQKFSNSQFTTLKCFLCISRISNTLLNTLRWTSNCSYFSCHLFRELSEIIVENESIMLESQQSDCWYFLPYIHPGDHCISLFYTQKSLELHPTPGHLPDPLPPLLAAIVFGFGKTSVPIFVLYYPLYAHVFIIFDKRKRIYGAYQNIELAPHFYDTILFFLSLNSKTINTSTFSILNNRYLQKHDTTTYH